MVVVSVGTGTLTVNLWTEVRSQPMGGTKVSANGKIGFHPFSHIICPKLRMFKQLDTN
jgi:hypothetical protein